MPVSFFSIGVPCVTRSVPTVRMRPAANFGVLSSEVGLRVAAPAAPCSVYTITSLSSAMTLHMMDVSAMVECRSRFLAAKGEFWPCPAGNSMPTALSVPADARKMSATNATVLSATMISGAYSPFASGMPSTLSRSKSTGGPGWT